MTASELVKWFLDNFPEYVATMRLSNHAYSVEDNNPYHLEGDVWTHTMMVLKVSELQDNTDIIDYIACLLHDLGKPSTREEIPERKRVMFKGHEGVSYYLAIDVIDKLIEDNIIPSVVKQLILETINKHGDYFDYFDSKGNFKSESDKRKVLNSFKGKPELAYRLGNLIKCDHLGRFNI